jgi:ankyrin repeat protein
VAVLVAAGADLDAAGIPGDPSQETPLHWAASNDDVELVDALLDAGADVNVPGSVIGGLGPIADAAVFGGQRAGRRLVELEANGARPAPAP